MLPLRWIAYNACCVTTKENLPFFRSFSNFPFIYTTLGSGHRKFDRVRACVVAKTYRFLVFISFAIPFRFYRERVVRSRRSWETCSKMETILRRALRSMAAVGLWRSPAFDPFVPLSVLPPSAVPFTRHPHFGQSRFGANLRACTRESRTQPRPDLTWSTASYSSTCNAGSCPTYSSANSLTELRVF